MKTAFDKTALAACTTWGEAQDYFNSIMTASLTLYVDALETAKEYTDLTMRDEFLLQVAVSTLGKRPN